MSLSWLSPSVVAFVLAGGLVSLLTLTAGLLIKPVETVEPVVIECATFPLTLDSTSLFRFAALAGQSAHLDLDFLDLDGDIIQTRQLDLAPGATMAFSMPTRYVGIAIQVIASAPVEVETTYVAASGPGAAERRIVPCQRITEPVRGGGP